jgi:hypothetical protein
MVANENRDWRIIADFGEYLIKTVRPMYSNRSIPKVKHTLKSNLSVYEIMQISDISVFDKIPVKELLTES